MKTDEAKTKPTIFEQTPNEPKKKNFEKNFQVRLKITLADIMIITNRHLEKEMNAKINKKIDLCFDKISIFNFEEKKDGCKLLRFSRAIYNWYFFDETNPKRENWILG